MVGLCVGEEVTFAHWTELGKRLQSMTTDVGAGDGYPVESDALGAVVGMVPEQEK